MQDPVPAPRKQSGQCLKVVDFLINDILMVLFSMCDIVLDILVCLKFYTADQMGFFYASLAIFLFAQCCYSFLFTLHWGKNYTSPQKALIFFLVLPFGQFVPFLAWIESFDFHWVNRLFSLLDLHTNNNGDDAATREFEEAGGDLLYDYIQKKFYSHAGFLVEALAEAIPQSILQTIAVLYFGEPSPLFIISIFVSICVISSKGYLISYSMHRPTFVFNFICIFADVLCMFATICWLFNYDDEDDESTTLFDVHDEVKSTWMCLFCGAATLMIVSSGSFIIFITLNKHHELDVGSQVDRYASGAIMCLELYLAHFLSWFFSLIPMMVSLMTFKFIFFPISIQNQDQCNDFAKYKTFYSALHAFVSKSKSDLKLHITNKFLLQCKGNQHTLVSALSGKYGSHQKKQAVKEWLETIGSNCRNEPKLNDKTTTLFRSLQATDPKLARSTVRQFNTQTEFHMFDGRPFAEELSIEFKICETFFKSRDDFPTYKKPFAYLRYCVGICFFAIGLPSFILFLPTALVFLLYSWFYPLVELLRALVQEDFSFSAIATLPLCLALAYLFTIVLMLCLAPNIYNFNRMCTDIVPLACSGLPPPFFDVAVVKQIEIMFHAELSWQHLDVVLDDMFGMDITLVIKSYCDTGGLNVEGLYGSRNMRKLRMPQTAPSLHVPLLESQSPQ